MFKFVRKSSLEQLETDKQQLQAELLKVLKEKSELSLQLSEARQQTQEDLLKLREAEEEAACLEKLFKEQEYTEFTIRFSDDLTTVTPIFKWKPGVDQKLIELGVIADTPDVTDMSIQVAILTLGFDAVTNLVDTFVQPLSDED